MDGWTLDILVSASIKITLKIVKKYSVHTIDSLMFNYCIFQNKFFSLSLDLKKKITFRTLLCCSFFVKCC